jgi:hypothetical protein
MQLKTKPMGAIFAKYGYNRKTNQKVLHGPRSLGGQGFIRWYTLQGEEQIQLFIKFWRTPSQASMLLQVALAWVLVRPCQIGFPNNPQVPAGKRPREEIP